MKFTLIIVSIIFVLFLLDWIGLHVKPQPFSMPALPQAEQKSFPVLATWLIRPDFWGKNKVSCYFTLIS